MNTSFTGWVGVIYVRGTSADDAVRQEQACRVLAHRHELIIAATRRDRHEGGAEHDRA